MSRNRRWALGLSVMAAAYMGCASERATPDADELDADELRTATRTPKGDYTVFGAYINRCTTASVLGLSEQLIAEVNCMNPGHMERIDAIDGVTIDDSVFPYLQTIAAQSLRESAKEKSGVQVTSALRSLPQQYMLYRWYQRGRCGISLAAAPGTSPHESGLALDLQNWSSMRRTMEKNDYRWFGNSDSVHFTFDGDGAIDLAGNSIRAFVSLWNRNNPTDTIPPDTATYTRTVASRLMKAPSTGFDLGPSCGGSP